MSESKVAPSVDAGEMMTISRSEYDRLTKGILIGDGLRDTLLEHLMMFEDEIKLLPKNKSRRATWEIYVNEVRTRDIENLHIGPLKDNIYHDFKTDEDQKKANKIKAANLAKWYKDQAEKNALENKHENTAVHMSKAMIESMMTTLIDKGMITIPDAVAEKTYEPVKPVLVPQAEPVSTPVLEEGEEWKEGHGPVSAEAVMEEKKEEAIPEMNLDGVEKKVPKKRGPKKKKG